MPNRSLSIPLAVLPAKPVAERLNSAIATVVQVADVKEKLSRVGAFAISTTPKQASLV